MNNRPDAVILDVIHLIYFEQSVSITAGIASGHQVELSFGFAVSVAVLLAGSISSSLIGGVLGYDNSTEGAVRFATAISLGFFVVGGICSLVPAVMLHRRITAKTTGKSANPTGFIVFAIVCIPIVSAIVILLLAICVIIVAVITGNFSAT